MKKNKLFILILIFIFAFLLRIINLTEDPNGFFCDEASIGYNAYSIWKTGKDEYNTVMPLFFRSFGDYKNPVFIYSSAPVVGILGLSEFSVRLTSVIYGLLAIYAIYLLATRLFNPSVGLISAFLLVISPWHIHFSRIGFELISSVLFVILAVYFFKKKYWLSIIFFILAFFSYATPKFYLIPLFLILFFQNYRQYISSKKFWLTNIIALLFMACLIIPNIKNGTFFARWNQLSDQNIKTTEFTKAYLNYFSIDFLFKKGDIDFTGQGVTRHSVKGIGELYWFQLPLIIIFLFSLFYKPYRQSKIFILLFLLIYPLGSTFASINPQASRSIIGVVPLTIASAYGFWILSKFKILKYLLIFLSLYGIYSFTNLYLDYPNYSSDFWGWQYGPKEIIPFYISQVNNYDQFCIEGVFNAPDTFVKFYDPQDKCLGKCGFCSPEINDPQKRQLFAISTDYAYDETIFKLKHIIFYPNSKIAFKIISNHD